MVKKYSYKLLSICVFLAVTFIISFNASASEIIFEGSETTTDKTTVIVKNEIDKDERNIPYLRIFQDSALDDFLEKDYPSNAKTFQSVSFSQKINSTDYCEYDSMNEAGVVVSVSKIDVDDKNFDSNGKPASYFSGRIAIEAESADNALEILKSLVDKYGVSEAFAAIIADSANAYYIEAQGTNNIEYVSLSKNDSYKFENKFYIKNGVLNAEGAILPTETSDIIFALRNDETDYTYQTFYRIHNDVAKLYSVEQWLAINDAGFTQFVPHFNASIKGAGSYETCPSDMSYNSSLIGYITEEFRNRISILDDESKALIRDYYEDIENILISQTAQLYDVCKSQEESDSTDKVLKIMSAYALRHQDEFYNYLYTLLSDINWEMSTNGTRISIEPVINLKYYAMFRGFAYKRDSKNKLVTLKKDNQTLTITSEDDFANMIGILSNGNEERAFLSRISGERLLVPYTEARDMFSDYEVLDVNADEYVSDFYAKPASVKTVIIFFGAVAVFSIGVLVILFKRKKGIKRS